MVPSSCSPRTAAFEAFAASLRPCFNPASSCEHRSRDFANSLSLCHLFYTIVAPRDFYSECCCSNSEIYTSDVLAPTGASASFNHRQHRLFPRRRKEATMTVFQHIQCSSYTQRSSLDVSSLVQCIVALTVTLTPVSGSASIQRHHTILTL